MELFEKQLERPPAQRNDADVQVLKSEIGHLWEEVKVLAKSKEEIQCQVNHLTQLEDFKPKTNLDSNSRQNEQNMLKVTF